MRRIKRVLRLSFLRRRDVVEEVDEELEFHLAMREAKLRAAGLSAAEAARSARLVFGDVNTIRDDCLRESERLAKKERVMLWLDDVRHDVHFAIRSLSRAKGFALAVILTLALGIGANATIFSLVNSIVLRPVGGVRDVAQLFELSEVVSYPIMRGLQETLPRLELAGVRDREMAIGAGSSVETAVGELVSGNFFAVTGVRTVMGRALTQADDTPGAPAVLVLSHGYWTRALGEDPAILGRVLTVGGAPVTVVGVAAPEFRGLHLTAAPAFWVPMNIWPLIRPSSMRSANLNERGWEWVTMVGRLAPGMSLTQAHDAVTRVWLALEPESKREDVLARTTPRPAQAAKLSSDAHSAVVRFSAILMGVVGLVLLTACANIAGLMLSRAAYRQREIAVRVALGAGRWRLARQLFTETMVLASAGGAAGIALFLASRSLLARIVLPGGMDASSFAIADARLLLFAAAITILTGVLVGLAPALQAARGSAMTAIKEGARHGRSQPLLRGMLVSAQVAVALVLLVGTGLFARALTRALAVDIGFDAEHVIAISTAPDMVQFNQAATGAFLVDAARRVEAIPGVSRVSWGRGIPLTSGYDRQTATVEGYTPAPDERVRFEYTSVGPNYHEVMGIPLVSGRGFEQRDLTSAPVLIINETAAKRYFPNRSPLGARITMGGRTGQVVGVSRDLKYHELSEEPRPYLYLAQTVTSHPVLLVQTAARAEFLLRQVEVAVRSTNQTVPVLVAGVLRDRLQTVLAPQRGGVWLLGIFGALALTVAIVGIYGVVAYAVAQRTREIGIRMAIGARPAQVTRAMVTGNLRFVAAGITVGLALSVFLARAASSFLFGVRPSDPLTLIATVAFMLFAALTAAYLPASRGTRIDPVRALRSD